MNKLTTVLLAGAAVFAMSGCTGEGNGISQNIRMVADDSTDEGYTDYSIVTVRNNSSYTIDQILTAKGNGAYGAVKPPKDVFPGEDRTFKTYNCENYDEAWTIQVNNVTGDYAEVDFKRQCGFHEYFTVVDN